MQLVGAHSNCIVDGLFVEHRGWDAVYAWPNSLLSRACRALAGGCLQSLDDERGQGLTMLLRTQH